jgi:hypothetical protein
MDAQSRRVANEIVEAGLTAVKVPDHPSLADVTTGLLELAVTLTFSMQPLRNVDRTESDLSTDLYDVAIREGLAQECHHWGAAAVTQGTRTARMALMLSGVEHEAAAVEAGGTLRSIIAEESDGRDADTLIHAGHTNFVMAAAALSIQGATEGSPDLRDFARMLVESLVPAVVQAAATARAIEQLA